MVTPVSTISTLDAEGLIPPIYPTREKSLPPGNGEETEKPDEDFELPDEEPVQKPEKPKEAPEKQKDRTDGKLLTEDKTQGVTNLHPLNPETITTLTAKLDKKEEELITGVEKETQEKLPNAT